MGVTNLLPRQRMNAPMSCQIPTQATKLRMTKAIAITRPAGSDMASGSSATPMLNRMKPPRNIVGMPPRITVQNRLNGWCDFWACTRQGWQHGTFQSIW